VQLRGLQTPVGDFFCAFCASSVAAFCRYADHWPHTHTGRQLQDTQLQAGTTSGEEEEEEEEGTRGERDEMRSVHWKCPFWLWQNGRPHDERHSDEHSIIV